MTTYERRQLLIDLLRTQPGLRVPEIASALDVSAGTVRNDLNALEAEGRLTRFHRRRGTGGTKSLQQRLLYRSPSRARC